MNTIKNALIAANAAYIARKGANAKLNKNGLQEDIASAIDTLGKLAPATIALFPTFCDVGIACKRIGESTNVKKALRALDVLSLLATDDMKYCRASAKVFVIEYAGLLCANVKTREGLRFVATGKGDENTSDSVSVSKARALRNALGATGITSVQTQESVAWSNGGLGEILQATVPGTGARGKRAEIVQDAPLLTVLNAWFAKLTDGKIALIAKQKGDK